MTIHETLTEMAYDSIISEKLDRNKRKAGRRSMVNRIRQGKVQIMHTVSEVPGFKVVNGQLVMMKPEERRKRKRAARITARKRSVKMAQILRKRNISLRKRKARFGD